MGDRAIIQQFQRALSSDINDLQSMLRRRMDDVLRYLGSQRRHPSAFNPNFSGTELVPETWFVGCEVTRLDTQTIRVHPGAMASESPPQLTLGALDSTQQIGINRTNLDVTVPVDATATLGNRYLLSARVATVVTLTEPVDIYDVPTQTFVPTSHDRRSELRIETRFDAGPSTGVAGMFGFAAFDAPPAGQGWEPLAHVAIFANTADPGHLKIWDVRRDLHDVLRAQDFDTLVNHPTIVLQRSITSGAIPTSDQSGIKGWFVADSHGRRFQIQCPATGTGLDQVTNDGEVLAADTQTHVYLCPLVKGSIVRVPSSGDSNGSRIELTRGVLLVTQNPALAPNSEGDNPSGLRLPATGTGTAALWVDFDVIPAGQAVHVCSYKTQAVSNTWARRFAASGTRHRYQWSQEDNDGAPVALAGQITASAAANIFSCDISEFVPPGARIVTLAIWFKHTASNQDGAHVFAEFGPTEIAGMPNDRVLATATGMFGAGAGTDMHAAVDIPIWVPNGSDPVNTATDAMLTDLDVRVSTDISIPAADPMDFEVRVLGWEL